MISPMAVASQVRQWAIWSAIAFGDWGHIPVSVKVGRCWTVGWTHRCTFSGLWDSRYLHWDWRCGSLRSMRGIRCLDEWACRSDSRCRLVVVVVNFNQGGGFRKCLSFALGFIVHPTNILFVGNLISPGPLWRLRRRVRIDGRMGRVAFEGSGYRRTRGRVGQVYHVYRWWLILPSCSCERR